MRGSTSAKLRFSTVSHGSERAYIRWGVSARAVIVLLLLLAATFLRLIMSLTLHMWFAEGLTTDDALFVNYTFSEHYTTDNWLTMVKVPGYAYWLFFTSKIGLTPDLAYFLIWLAAALVMAYALYRISGKQLAIAAFAYLYILWNPIAFDVGAGTRMYRNSLFPPLLFLLIGAMLVWMDCRTPLVKSRGAHAAKGKLSGHSLPAFVCWGILFGAAFGLVYLLKEGAIWILPLGVVALAYKVVALSRERERERESKRGGATRWRFLMAAMIPVFVVIALVGATLLVHWRCFGVAMLDTRTGGELATFVSHVYEVDNDEQDGVIWAPASSIEAAFDVSPTLQENPNLLWNLEHVGFTTPDIAQNPLMGDFLTWQIRVAYDCAYGWDDEAEVQAFFAQVNDEIEIAFEDGRLKRTDKAFLTSTLVPRYLQEIPGLISSAGAFWTDSLIFSKWSVSTMQNNTEITDEYARMLERLNIDPSDPNPALFPFFTYEDAQGVATVVKNLYVALNVMLALALAAATIVHFLPSLRKRLRNNSLLLAGAWGLALYAFAYCFVVAWWGEFLTTRTDYITLIYFYFSCIAVPFNASALLTGVAVWSNAWNQRGLPVRYLPKTKAMPR